MGMKIFYRYERTQEFVLAIIVSVFVISLLLIASYLLMDSFEFFRLLIMYGPIVLIILGFGYYRFSYKLVLSDGKIIEKQFLKTQRELTFQEVIGIEGTKFLSSAGITFPLSGTLGNVLRHKLREAYVFPKINNNKYKNFPRYALSGDLATEMKKVIPNLDVDQDLISRTEQRKKEKWLEQLGLLLLLIIVVGMAIYYMTITDFYKDLIPFNF